MSQLGSLSPNGRSEKVEIVVPAGGGSDRTVQQDGITSPDPASLGGAPNTTNDVPTMAADLTQPPPVKVQAALNARAYHRLNLDQETNLWTEYVTQADALDKDLVKTLTADLDTLLIFAGLFSAINTAFVIESYKDLKIDQAELTNDILRSVFNKLSDASINITLPDTPFVAPSRAVRANCLFLVSLSCSLLTALGAVLGKQWLAYYDQENRLRPPSERGRDRHRKYLGAKTWHLQAVIQTLPTLLQVSFFLFFAAQIDLFWYIHKTVAGVIIAFGLLTLFFYAITTLIATFAFGSPFQTRLSALLRRIKQRIMQEHDTEDGDDVIGAQCVNWLLETTTLPTALVASVRAVAKLSDKACREIEFDVTKIMKLVFKPVALGTKVQLGISTDSLCSSLPGLVSLIHRVEGFSWQDILPLADAGRIKLALYDALLKVHQSRPSDIQISRWIAGLFATLPPDEPNDTTDFDTLYTSLLENLPSFSSSAQPYTDLATICFLVNKSAPASLIADILGVPFPSLKEYITSHSLDPFFVVPSKAEECFCLVHELSMQLVMCEASSSELQALLPLPELNRIKASLCNGLLKVYGSRPDDPELGRWIAKFFAPIQMEGSEVPTELDAVYMTLLPNLHLFSLHDSPSTYTDLATICHLAKDSAPTSLIADILRVSPLSLENHIASLALDAFFVVPDKPEKPLQLLHQSPMQFIENPDRVIGLSSHVGESHKRIAKYYLESMVATLKKDIAGVHRTRRVRLADLPAHQQGLVPSTLQLYCTHWSAHLDSRVHDAAILSLVTSLLEIHFFHWMEVLALYNKLDVAIPSLKRAQYWLATAFPTSRLIQLCIDSQELIKRFGRDFNYYVHSIESVLPFLPQSSIRDTYHRQIPPSSPSITLPLASDVSWGIYPIQLVGPYLSCSVNSVIFSPDGSRVISASDDYDIYIWDKSDVNPIRTLKGHTNAIDAVTLSPDGKYIISGSKDESVKMWELESGNSILTLNGHTNRVGGVAVSKDGNWIASSSADQTVRLWEISTGNCRQIFTGHSHWVRSVAFSPDGNQIISGSDDKTVRVWSVSSGEAIRVLEGPGRVNCVTFTNDGKQILSASDDATIRIWDSQTGDCVRVLEGHNGNVMSIATTTSDRYILSGALDRTTCIWDMSTSSVVHVLQTSDRTRCVAASPDLSQLVCGGDYAKLEWCDFPPSHQLRPLSLVEFSLDGLTIKASFGDGSIEDLAVMGHTVQIEGVDDEDPSSSGPYTYSITPYDDNDEPEFHVGQIWEEINGEKRLMCRVPIALFWKGSVLIHSGRHIVIWHTGGLLLHLDFSSCPA